MKKYLIIFLILVIILPSALVAVQIFAADADDEVVYTEHTISGDPREADGIEVSLELSMDETLFWDVGLTLGEDIEEEVDFTFDYDPPRYVSEPRPHFDLGFGFTMFGTSSSGDILESDKYMYGMYDVIVDVAGRAAEGSEYSENVRLADYYDFYPINLDIRIGDFFFDSYSWRDSANAKYDDLMNRINDYFAENFRFPVADTDIQTVTVQKRIDGTVASANVNYADKSPGISLASQSAVSDDAVYFICVPRSEENGELFPDSDTEYGLYRIPYAIVEYDPGNKYSSREYTDIRIDETELVYPISAQAEAVDLTLSDDGDELYLTIREKSDGSDRITLTVLDCADMSVKQETFLFDCESGRPVYLVEAAEDFLLYKINWLTFAVIGRSSGEWQTDFTVTDQSITDYWSDQQYAISSYGYGIDYDGERLAIMAPSAERGVTGQSIGNSLASFYLSVYSEKGNIYTGKFTSSLDTGTELRYNYIVKPTDRYTPVIRLP